jgi:hypothetical protein
VVAEDFLRDPQVQQWLDGGRAGHWKVCRQRREPSAAQTAIQIGEIDGSPVARNTLIYGRRLNAAVFH